VTEELRRFGPFERTPEADNGARYREERKVWLKLQRGVRNNLLGEIGVQVLRFGGLMILARALDPADFGIFRILLAVAALSTLVNTAGIPDALVQRHDVQREHMSTAWWLSCLLGSLIASLLYVSAPLLGRAMAMPRLIAPCRVLCLPVFLESTSTSANAHLRRELNFAALATAEVIAEVVFFVVALVLLASGLRHACLGGALAARLSAHALALWWSAGYIPTAKPTVRAAGDLARFAASVLSGQTILVCSSYADFVMVGRLLGDAALGRYAMAWDLLKFVPNRLYRVVGRVAFPAFCRLQGNNEQSTALYCELLSYNSSVILPLVACLAVAAPQLLGGLYGPQWVAAAAPLRLLAPGLATFGLRSVVGAVYYAKDRPAFDIWLHGTRLVLILGAVVLSAPYGLNAVSLAMSAVEGSISCLAELFVCLLLGVSVSRLIKASRQGFWLAFLLAGITGSAKLVIGFLGLKRPWDLLAIVAPATVCFSLILVRWRNSTALQWTHNS
jgi:lipopolysaccharide exporter